VTNTTFPAQLDTFINPQGTDSVQLVSHALQHSKVNDALYAIELKLGVTNSTDPSSVENRLLTLKAFYDNITTANVAESLTNLYFTDKRAKDAIAQALEDGTHSHISFTYNNDTGAISLSTSPEVVLNSGLQNTLGDYLTTSAFNAQLDEPGGTPTLDENGLIRDSQISSTITRDSELTAGIADAKSYADTKKAEAISAAAQDATTKADAALSAAGYYTDEKVANLVNSAPQTLDTLKELADALGDDPNFATTMATQLGTKSNVGHTHTSSNVTDFVEAAQDAAGLLFNHSSHNNLTATYDDENNKVILTVTPQLTQEQVQDYIAPLFTHGNNKNMNILYDDEANQLTFEAITEPSKAVMSATAPVNPANGAFWLDTDELRSGDVLALKIWNAAGNKWEYAASALSLATTNVWTSKNTFNQGIIMGMDVAPSNPVEGQIYYNLAAEKLRVFDGLVWKDVSGGAGGGGGLPSISTDGTATPATLFFGMIAPPSAAALEGDIWFDVDDLGTPFNQFFTGTTAPDPTQYEFWVDPSLQPGELIYSATEPQTPSFTGELWIDTDDLDGQLVQIGTTAPDPANAQLWVDTQDLDTPTYYSNLYFPTYNSVSEFPYAVSKPGMVAVDSSTNIVYVSINGGWVPQPLNTKVQEVEVNSRSNEALIWMGFL
jgi:hypothetical protein